MSSLVLGTETLGTTADVLVTKPFACRFVASAADALDGLHVKLSTGGTATEVWLAVAQDGTEGKVPGTVIAEGKVAFATEATVALGTGEIAPGVAYWLIVAPGANGVKLKRTAPTEGESHRSSIGTKVGVVQPSKVTEWTAEQTGPMAIWATGNPVGQTIALEAAASQGAAALAITAKTQVPLEAGVSASAGSLSLTAGGGAANIPLAAAASTAAASLAVTAPTKVLLQPASGESAGEAAVAAGGVLPYGPEPKQTLKLWKAPHASSPIVIFVAGGGWVDDQSETIAGKAEGFWTYAGKKAGFMVGNVDYRNASTTVAAFPMEIEDVEAAVRLAIKEAAAYNGDPRNVVLLGGSAGGHLVTIAAERMNAVEPTVRLVIELSGIYDLQVLTEEMETGAYKAPHAGGNANNLIEHTQMALQQTLNYTGGGTSPPIVAGKPLTSLAASRAFQDRYSPSRQASPTACKYFMYSYEEDLIPTNQWEAMRLRLEGEGRTVTVKIAAGAGHAFSIVEAKPNQTHEEWYNAIVEPQAVNVNIAPAASAATATTSLRAATSLALGAAAAESAGAATITTPGAAILTLGSASSLSAASGVVRTVAPVPFASSDSTSAGSLHVTVIPAPPVQTPQYAGRVNPLEQMGLVNPAQKAGV